MPLRVLLVAPPEAAARAVARLRARGPVAPALVPSAETLAAALGRPWDAVLVLPGSEVGASAVAEALAAASTRPPCFVEARTVPPPLTAAVHLAPGETATLPDHLADAPPPSASVIDSAVDTDPDPVADADATLDTGAAPDAAPRIGTFGAVDGLAADHPVGLYRTTPDGRLLYGNAALADVLAQPLEALYTLDVRTDLGYPRDHFAHLMATDGSVRNLITTWVRTDGRRVHTRENARAVTGPDGSVCAFEGTMEDVTETVEASRALAARARQHRAVARFAVAAAGLADQRQILDEATLALRDALDAEWTVFVRPEADGTRAVAWAGALSPSRRDAPETRQALAALSLATPDDSATALAPLREALGAASVLHTPVADGARTLGVLLAGYADADAVNSEARRGAEALAWTLAAHLVRRRAERDLGDSATSLRHIVAHADLIPYRQRLDGSYADLHPGIEALTGYRPAEVEAAGGLDGLADTREVLRGHRVLEDPETARDEPVVVRYTFARDGDAPPRAIEARVGRWRSLHGAVIGWVGTYQDVTEQAAATAALRDAHDQAERDADAARREAQQRTVALAELSHEIRTPLTGVIGFAEVLAAELDAPHDDIAELILDGGRSMLDTITSVLDHARLEADGAAPELVPADLAVVVRPAAERLRALADDRGLPLVLDLAPDTWAALDAAAVARIVTNLVGNAVKYTEAGTLEVAVFTDGPDACLVVRDRGPGIPESVREHLFEPFRAGDPETAHSTGLGLSIVNRLVEALGGTISVEDRAPGTEVTVRLPRIHPPATLSAQPTPDPMTHPLPSPSDDGQADAAPRAPHEGDGHAAFVARPQPSETPPPSFAPPGFAAPPAGAMPPPVGHTPAPPAPAAGFAPPAVPQAPAPAAPHGYAPPPAAPAYAAPPAFAPAAPQGFAPQAPAVAQAPAAHAPAAPPAYAPPAPAMPRPAAPAPAPQGYAAPDTMPPAAAPAPAPQAATPQTPATPEAAPSSDKPRILVVEDNNDTRMLLDRILRRTYDVTAVGDARSALVAMHSGRFDGLVLDINLGGKETGADILRIARSLDGYQGVFAIALTAYALPGDRERLLEKGFSEYISKPFTRSSLMDALAKGVSV